MLNDPTVMLIYNTIEQMLSVYVSVLLTLYKVISSLY
jgi:hypothetical protein